MSSEKKTSNREVEEELSMDEILSSIRSIITEEKDVDKATKRIFSEDSTTNPSGARPMEDIPKFDNNDGFTLPKFYEQVEETPKKREKKIFALDEVFPDEEFQLKQVNERALSEENEPYFRKEKYFREVGENAEDRLSSALKTIVDSYATQKLKEAPPEPDFNLDHSKIAHSIDKMIEKIIVKKVESWLHENLSTIIEKTIVKELERIASEMRI